MIALDRAIPRKPGCGGGSARSIITIAAAAATWATASPSGTASARERNRSVAGKNRWEWTRFPECSAGRASATATGSPGSVNEHRPARGPDQHRVGGRRSTFAGAHDQTGLAPKNRPAREASASPCSHAAPSSSENVASHRTCGRRALLQRSRRLRSWRGRSDRGRGPPPRGRSTAGALDIAYTDAGHRPARAGGEVERVLRR